MPASWRTLGAPASRARTSCLCVFWSPAVAKKTGSVWADSAPTWPATTAATSPDHCSTGAWRHAR
eukprot:11181380-Alexandrium_andersonii.AAC.1